MVWLCSAVTRANDTGKIRLRLQDGEVLAGELHPEWVTQGKGVPMLCVLDLSNAYKQLPLHPSCRKYSRVTLLNPETCEPACFEGKVLPFGSTASVVHFNRCSRLLQCIGWHLFILWGNYSRRSAAGSARTKVTRCHKRKCRCRSRSNILCHNHPKTVYLAQFLCPKKKCWYLRCFCNTAIYSVF